MTEPNSNNHHIFDTYEEAYEVYMSLSNEIREIIDPPRQSHNCWIFDKYNND